MICPWYGGEAGVGALPRSNHRTRWSANDTITTSNRSKNVKTRCGVRRRGRTGNLIKAAMVPTPHPGPGMESRMMGRYILPRIVTPLCYPGTCSQRAWMPAQLDVRLCAMAYHRVGTEQENSVSCGRRGPWRESRLSRSTGSNAEISRISFRNSLKTPGQ
jgi:hypothetical protein